MDAGLRMHVCVPAYTLHVHASMHVEFSRNLRIEREDGRVVEILNVTTE